MAYPQHAGDRCGMTVAMRRWVTGRKLSQIGIWRHNPFPTTRWISASIVDRSKRPFTPASAAAKERIKSREKSKRAKLGEAEPF